MGDSSLESQVELTDEYKCRVLDQKIASGKEPSHAECCV